MIYLLKSFKKSFINKCKNFYNDENGNAVSVLIIFNSVIILLISILLFFIYGWEMNLLREEISDIVMRELYSSISKENLNSSNENIEKFETFIKEKIKEKFIYSYNKRALLKNLSNENLYETKETDLIVNITVLDSENDFNSVLIKVRVELKFVFPIIFLMNFVKNDTFIYYKNSNKKQIKKRRVNFIFEELYTIY